MVGAGASHPVQLAIDHCTRAPASWGFSSGESACTTRQSIATSQQPTSQQATVSLDNTITVPYFSFLRAACQLLIPPFLFKLKYFSSFSDVLSRSAFYTLSRLTNILYSCASLFSHFRHLPFFPKTFSLKKNPFLVSGCLFISAPFFSSNFKTSFNPHAFDQTKVPVPLIY